MQYTARRGRRHRSSCPIRSRHLSMRQHVPYYVLRSNRCFTRRSQTPKHRREGILDQRWPQRSQLSVVSDVAVDIKSLIDEYKSVNGPECTNAS